MKDLQSIQMNTREYLKEKDHHYFSKHLFLQL